MDMQHKTSSNSLLPLEASLHADALQRVYELSPAYWAMYHLAQAPAGQAARDLAAIEAEPGRMGLGIVAANEPGNPQAGAQLVGLIDFRLHWPDPDAAYIGIVLVAEPFQRQGVGSNAWALLEPWLAAEAGLREARLGVEQFNPGALRFFPIAWLYADRRGAAHPFGQAPGASVGDGEGISLTRREDPLRERG